MELFGNLALGLETAFTLQNLFYCLVGVFVGTAVGVLPGLGPVATIAMLLPATFGLPPESALIMLAGIYYGAQYGGSTTAILVNLPGESSSVVTALDGYQMARNGQAGKALATAAIASFFAGTVATVLLALAAPPLADMALKFGPAEYFSLMVLGLVASVVLASGSLLKAIGMVLLGLLLGLGRWVIDEACRQVASWREQGMGDVPVAVNLSTSQLASAALPDFVFERMRAHGVADGCLEMELTESMMMSDPERAIAILNRLREGGIALSIDDFGTGFSSMAYLRQLPVNTLKLDRSFVRNIAVDAKDADLCAGIMALAHKLDMHVVAEGVETREQHDALAAANCDLFQGYLFSRPLSAAQATDFLSR